MSADLAWKFWSFIAVVTVSNLAMLVLGYRVGRNKGQEPEHEQGDPHENTGTWGRQ